MPNHSPFSPGKNRRVRLPRELSEEHKIVEQLKLLEKAQGAWEAYVSDVARELQKVRDAIHNVQQACIRAQREQERGERSTKSKACQEVFDQCETLAGTYVLR